MVTIRFILSRIYYIRALLPLLTVKRIINLLLAIGYFLIKSPRSVIHPPILILSITTDCNYECIMCLKTTPFQKSVIDFKNPKEMEFETLEKFLREHSDYLSFVRLHGGEPLYYSNILDLVDLLNELNIPYNIVTNASLITGEMGEKFVKGSCVGIGFSLDAASPETYKSIRVGGDWEKIKRNIKHLSELKTQAKSIRPVFSASMCANSENISELADLVKFCKEYKIPALSVAEVIDQDTPGITNLHLIENNVEVVRAALVEASKVAKREGIILRARFPSLGKKRIKDIPYHKGKIKPKNCLNLYASAWVLPNYDFIGCSAVKKPFGNLKSSEFQNLWNISDTGYRGARKDFREGNVPKVCRECPYSGGFIS